MTAISHPAPAATVEAPAPVRLDRAQGIDLLGPVHGCGYRDGVSLVRRADGQMVQLGPLMYALLECLDGRRDAAGLADAVSDRLGRRLETEHVSVLARKLAAQGLLAGTEDQAPPKRNPLLALRWKVLVTDHAITRRLTTPFVWLFRPWVMWPVLAAFVAVFWFVLIHKGVASATAEAFHSPGLLLLVFALAVLSAGFHELGHAAACRYGGGKPGGMGMGLYLVWPAFYTEVTDAYRLPKRDRLRVDLGGLYFNTVVAVVTMGVWLVWRADALLLLVALQILQMVKQLSPIIRADGYHILSDATGVPDLFTQMGPTLRRLLPGHRHEPSALTGRARLLVSAWVLIVVPVLISLALSAILLLPRLATSAYDSGHVIAAAIPHQAADGQLLDVLASLVRLLALALPVGGCVLVMQKIVRTTVARARAWSAGQPVRRAVALSAGGLAVAAIAWAWWPAGQYQPVRPTQNGTIGGMVQLVSTPTAVARPVAAVTPGPGSASGSGPAGGGGPSGQVPAAPPPHLAPGTHLAVAMIPVGGATKRHPALFVIPGGKGKPPVAIVSASSPTPPPAGMTSATTPASATTTSAATAAPPSPTPAAAFPFQLPSPPGPGGTQALAENTTDGGVTYDVAYSLVTISGGAPVTNTNSAYALSHCRSCTTVAVSFQVVLVVGESRNIAPIDAAGALNYDCPACTTTAIADQMVVTLTAQPSAQLVTQLQSALKQLNALPSLGAGGTPAAVASQVAGVQQQIATELENSGLVAKPPKQTTTTATGATTTTTSTSGTTPAASPTGTTTAPSPTGTGTGSAATSPPATTGQTTTSAPTSSTPTSSTTTTTSTTPSSTTSSTTTTSTTPSSG